MRFRSKLPSALICCDPRHRNAQVAPSLETLHAVLFLSVWKSDKQEQLCGNRLTAATERTLRYVYLMLPGNQFKLMLFWLTFFRQIVTFVHCGVCPVSKMAARGR